MAALNQQPEEFEKIDDEEFVPAPPTNELFDGDAGGLTLDQRLCLVALLKNTFISSTEHPARWSTLIADDLLVKGRLNDMFLDLVIDHEREVAYKVQVREADGAASVPPLLKASAYSREETALLVFVRSRYTSERAAGNDQVWVDRVELHEYMESLRPEHSTDKVGDRKRTENAIALLTRAHILQGRQDSESFRISAVIESLLPVDALKSLLAWFQAQNRPDEEPGSSDDR